MAAFGPDLWNNAPSADSPITDLRAWLNTMAAAVRTWQPAANVAVWQERFAGVEVAIDDALAALPLEDVFARQSAVPVYNAANNRYQSVKDQFTLSSDWLLTAGEQAGIAIGSPDWLDRAMAFLRSLGIGLIGAAVLIIVLLVIVRRYLV